MAIPARASARAVWLQATSGPIRRHALPSLALTVGRDMRGGALAGTTFDLGWLRAARPTSSAEGVTAGLARPVITGPLTLRPVAAVMGGRAVSTVDSGGYDWRGIVPPALGQTGYQDRPRLTSGATFGAGVGLGAEVLVWRGVGIAGSAQWWRFSGGVLRATRAPVLAGFGVSYVPARRWERWELAPNASTAQSRSARSLPAQVAALQPDTVTR